MSHDSDSDSDVELSIIPSAQQENEISFEISAVAWQIWTYLTRNLAVLQKALENPTIMKTIKKTLLVSKSWILVEKFLEEIEFNENISEEHFCTILKEKIHACDITTQVYENPTMWSQLKSYLVQLKKEVLKYDALPHSSMRTMSTSFTTAQIPTPFVDVSAFAFLDADHEEFNSSNLPKKISTPLSHTSSKKGKNVCIQKCAYTTEPDILIEFFVTNLTTIPPAELYSRDMLTHRIKQTSTIFWFHSY